LIDHQDSFVHTLANYLRQTGASVKTLRSEHAVSAIRAKDYELVVLSPGPGCPEDFNLRESIQKTIDEKIPLFGVCLGLQGIVEYFGGKLGILDYPMHGKPSTIHQMGGKLFEGLPPSFVAGRYHSLYANSLPKELTATAKTEEGVVMAVEHVHLPIRAVQFHPETILSMREQIGLKIIENVMRLT